MTLIRRTLYLLLLGCTLAYTNAWAFEGVMQPHGDKAHAAEGVAAAVDMTDANMLADSLNGPRHDETAAHGCDHCCHNNAHILGMASASCPYGVAMRNSIVAVFTMQAASHISLQDSPPPRS